MKILFVSAEVYPFSKVGGLGDVIGTLPQKLAELGPEIRILTPAYQSVSKQGFGIDATPYKFNIQISETSYACRLIVWRPRRNIPLEIWFIENEQFYSNRNVYADDEGIPYEDNPERFLLLSKAVFEFIRELNWAPDIIHCHDNHTALVPLYLREQYRHESLLAEVKTLLTLHNIAYQGIVSMDRRVLFGLPERLFYPIAPLEWFGQINPLKAGILYADGVSTVSPTHAREISTDSALSAGLQGVLRSRSDVVYGILNGVDYEEWNPATDVHLKATYSPADLSGKQINKQHLLTHFGFSEEHLTRPLVGIVSRLVEQKGIDILIEAIDRLLDMELNIIVLGSGERRYRTVLEDVQKQFPDRFALRTGYSESLSHLIIAGSDLFLMPSRYEPCGITQMACLKYGTVPVVHRTGGLADTVKSWNGKTGTGFLFTEYTSSALVKAVRRALKVYQSRDEWRELMLQGMARDFSWRKSARTYLDLYQQLKEGGES